MKDPRFGLESPVPARIEHLKLCHHTCSTLMLSFILLLSPLDLQHCELLLACKQHERAVTNIVSILFVIDHVR